MEFDLTIDKQEVLRYLYHKNQLLDENLDNLISELIEETKRVSRPRYIYNFFLLKKEEDILLENTDLILKSKDIKSHLQYSSECVVMCATLGNEIEMRINYYSKTELLKSIILDACASTYIEALCDKAELSIKEEALHRKLYITERYSPGYGDFNISIQKDLLNIIEASKKIGVSVTDSFIMLPRKSVSAVIGIQKKRTEKNLNKCDLCTLNGTCNFRKENTYCGT